jgi:hypothetical protein
MIYFRDKRVKTGQVFSGCKSEVLKRMFQNEIISYYSLEVFLVAFYRCMSMRRKYFHCKIEPDAEVGKSSQTCIPLA